MKRILLLLGIACFMLNLSCSSELDVMIKLSNGQNKSVPFSGYYMFSGTGDSVIMSGNTPYEYNLKAKSGDQIKGMVYKNNSDLVDTLLFQIFINEEEKLKQGTTNRTLAITFTVDIL